MPPFWEELTASARLAYPVIQGGVRQGLSIADIGQIVRSSGLRIANDALSQAVALERDLVDRGSRLKFLPLDARPNPENLPEALTEIQRAYSFVVAVTGQVAGGARSQTIHVTVSTDSLLTRREIEDAAISAVEGNAGKYGIQTSGALIESGVRAGAAGIV